MAFTGRSKLRLRPGYIGDWNAATVLGVTAGETVILEDSMNHISTLPSPLRSKWERVRGQVFSRQIRPARVTAEWEQEQIKEAMQTFADFSYIPDTKDEWATPEEFCERRGGDCEDFAIARMRWLYREGFDEKKLALCIGVQRPRLVHAVLVVHTTTGQDYVLDNLHEHAKEHNLHRRWFTPLVYIYRNEWRQS